jgi:hypothetical protein
MGALLVVHSGFWAQRGGELEEVDERIPQKSNASGGRKS